MDKVLKVNNYIPKKVKLIRGMFHVCLMHTVKISSYETFIIHFFRYTLKFDILNFP